ncbi:MAG: CoA transferase, partial [Acidimicrobiia bacterium]|nr:CoA transferase [Acidimicrobiia bacterium]
DAIGRPDLGTDPRFATNDGRVAHCDHLRAELSAVLRTKPRREWLALLEEADVPADQVNTLAEIIDHPQVAARDMVVRTRREGGTEAVLAGSPIKVSGHRQHHDPPPRLGQHTDEVLREILGLDDAARDRLRLDGVIG